jgi:hypothetical protein
MGSIRIPIPESRKRSVHASNVDDTQIEKSDDTKAAMKITLITPSMGSSNTVDAAPGSIWQSPTQCP